MMPFKHSEPMFTANDLPQPEDFVSFAPFLKGVFSQWHQTPFELNDLHFNTAEQWMMYAKARLFDDDAAAEGILSSPDPAVQKRLGQLVRGFD